MQTLFVYYKVPVVEHGQCLSLVTRFEAALKAQWPALQIQIMQRPEASGEGIETWMEVYDHPGGVTQEMMTSIARQAADMGLPPKRATELFIPLRR
jgi:hypothetical protein